jgi:hypothetical protein
MFAEKYFTHKIMTILVDPKIQIEQQQYKGAEKLHNPSFFLLHKGLRKVKISFHRKNDILCA